MLPRSERKVAPGLPKSSYLMSGRLFDHVSWALMEARKANFVIGRFDLLQRVDFLRARRRLDLDKASQDPNLARDDMKKISTITCSIRTVAGVDIAHSLSSPEMER